MEVVAHQEFLAFLVLLGLRDKVAHKAPLVLLVLPVLKDPRAIKEHKAYRVLLGQEVPGNSAPLIS